jgi:L-aspartate oxidase
VADKLATFPIHTKNPEFPFLTLCEDKQGQESWKQKIRHIMWEYAGIVRTYSGLIQGLKQLRNLEKQISAQAIECQNMLQVAQMIISAAIWREESRGGHYRSDFPQTLENWARKQYMVEEKRL